MSNLLDGLPKRQIYVSGRISYKVVITCHQCGASAFSHHSTELQNARAEMIAAELTAEFNRSMPSIPVGWQMDGRTKLTCSGCRG